MKIYKILPQGFACNTYILTNDDKTAVVIDCAQDRIVGECERLNLLPKYVLLTHGHFDHIGGCAKLNEIGATICLNEREVDVAFSDANLAKAFGVKLKKSTNFSTFKDGDLLNLCGINIKVLSTPGHTVGGTSFIVENNIFTGDTLFYESVGRCDFPTGNKAQLMQSVKRLLALPGDYTVYCGHDKDTTLSHEREFNVYVN